MFSLIISIIAIALVAALAGASVYYGGAAFSNNGAKADASTLINHGQQVNGAYQLAIANSDGDVDTALADADLNQLVTAEYLTAVPTYKNVTYTLSNGYMTADVNEAVCLEIQERAGENIAVAGTPNGSAGASFADTGLGLYNCVNDTDATTPTPKFGYKVL